MSKVPPGISTMLVGGWPGAVAAAVVAADLVAMVGSLIHHLPRIRHPRCRLAQSGRRGTARSHVITAFWACQPSWRRRYASHTRVLPSASAAISAMSTIGGDHVVVACRRRCCDLAIAALLRRRVQQLPGGLRVVRRHDSKMGVFTGEGLLVV